MEITTMGWVYFVLFSCVCFYVVCGVVVIVLGIIVVVKSFIDRAALERSLEKKKKESR